MNKTIAEEIRELAKRYHTPDFITRDPIQFPHHFTDKKDIEISAFITTWITFGNRECIIRKLEEFHQAIDWRPFEFIRNTDNINQVISKMDKGKKFYRFYSYEDLRALCLRLQRIYTEYHSLEEAVMQTEIGPDIHRHANIHLYKLQSLFSGIKGIPEPSSYSACKRLALFLRWMVRQDRTVDLGIWKQALQPKDLIIPLDTHVIKIAIRLGLIPDTKSQTQYIAQQITDQLRGIFPDDPCLGDFALFGKGEEEANQKSIE